MSAIYHEFKGFSVETKEFTSKHTMGVPHYHYAYEIFLPLEGMMTLLIGDEIIATDRTNIVLSKKGIPHGNYSKSEHKRTVIYFDDEFLDMFLTEEAKNVLLSGFDKRLVSPEKEVLKRIRECAEELEKTQTREDIFRLLCEILILISYSPEAKRKSVHSFNKTLGAVLSYINLNFEKIESVKDLSREFFVSESYLCRLFKEGMGTTVTEYINMV
ncbi:MAG: AraC family transcriptional regulator, partial [Clostridia bacterium]|nr:AraC family transcriptional regulator [Clostridia bacterium]